jgi:hypothetical protein
MQIGKNVNLHGFGDCESGGMFLVPHVFVAEADFKIFVFDIVQRGLGNYV